MKRVIFIICILFLVSCGGSKRLSNTNLAFKYSPGLNFIFPEYSLYNISDSTCRLFFILNPSDLLFKNVDSLNGFQSEFSISYRLLQNYDSKESLVTGQQFFVQKQVEDANFRITNYIDFSAQDGFNYILEITCTDIYRDQAVIDYLKVDRTGIQPENDFMIIDTRWNKPLVTGYCDEPSRFKIHHNKDTSAVIYMRYFKNDYPLALPPFSNSSARPLSYKSDKTLVLNKEMDDIVIADYPGIYHFQFDTLIQEGYTFFYFDEDFPRLTSATGLIESIRYLTTREEYSKIQTSKNKKEAVDDFWLQLGGNRERARLLIKSYYSRVQLTNRFFTSYVEGWKTDRGLIYIIFGPPASVYRSSDSESWNYSSNSYYGTLNFTFDKIKNPFTDNDYKLRRNKYYEIPWYKAVDSWRDGRVVNDNY